MSKKIPLQDLHYNLNVWISKTLSIPNSTFNHLPPCPYAKKAWMEDKVEVCAFDSWVDAYSTLLTREYDFSNTEFYCDRSLDGRLLDNLTEFKAPIFPC